MLSSLQYAAESFGFVGEDKDEQITKQANSSWVGKIFVFFLWLETREYTQKGVKLQM